VTTKILLSMVLFASVSAFAADGGGNGSQFQWQTPADKMELTAGLIYQDENGKLKGGGSDELSGLSERVRFEYGISEMWSTGAQLMNSNLTEKITNTPNTTKSGLADLDLFLYGRSAMGSASLRYGTDLGFSLAKHKTESNGDANISSGGLSLTPFLGYEMYNAPCTYGVRMSYKLFFGDRSYDNNGTDEKIIGPNQVTTSFFFEHDMKPMLLGAALEIINVDKTKTKISSVTTDAVGSHSAWNLKLYVPYEMGTTTILPQLNYGNWTAKASTIDSVSDLEFEIAARFQM
jgi:hypothetical protein